MKKAQGLKGLAVFNAGKMKLDLGCGNCKLPGSFGVDFLKTKSADLEWDLEKELPKRFWNKYDIVFSSCVLDHMGNPLQFLSNCKKYAKPNGYVQIVVDNADYWRYHKKGKPFGNYHALLWFKESEKLKVQHKMMFQPEHLETLFKIVGLEIVEKQLFWRKSVDWLFPKHLGTAYFSIVGKKTG